MDRERFDTILADHRVWLERVHPERAERTAAALAELDPERLREAVTRTEQMADFYRETHYHLVNLPEGITPDGVLDAQDHARGSMKDSGRDDLAYRYAYHPGGIRPGDMKEWGDIGPAYLDAHLHESGLISVPRTTAERLGEKVDHLMQPAVEVWEAAKQRIGAWLSREQVPEAEPDPPAAQRAPSAAQDGPAPSSPAPSTAGAENTPERSLSVAETGREPAGGQSPATRPLTYEEGRAAYHEVLERRDEIKATIAGMADPAEREKAERLLATVQQDATARQRSPERTAELDR